MLTATKKKLNTDQRSKLSLNDKKKRNQRVREEQNETWVLRIKLHRRRRRENCAQLCNTEKRVCDLWLGWKVSL